MLKKILIGAFFCASVLSMGIKVERDYDGNITLEGLKSTEARASTQEGYLIEDKCIINGELVGYGASCAQTSTSECIPNPCKIN